MPSFFDHLLGTADILNRTYDRLSQSLRVMLSTGSITLNAGDIEIGAVEIKDSASDNRVRVNADGTLDVNVVLAGPGDTIALTDSSGSVINPATDSTSLGGVPINIDVDTSPTLLVAANLLRRKVLLFNLSATQMCFLGDGSVSIFTGIPLPPMSAYSDSMPFCGTEALYAVVQTSSASLRIKQWE